MSDIKIDRCYCGLYEFAHGYSYKDADDVYHMPEKCGHAGQFALIDAQLKPTLRDQFAMVALSSHGRQRPPDEAADTAYKYADAMLKRRQR